MESKATNQTANDAKGILLNKIKDILDYEMDNEDKYEQISKILDRLYYKHKLEKEFLKYKLDIAELEVTNYKHKFKFLELSNQALQMQNEILLTYKPKKSLFKRLFNLD